MTARGVLAFVLLLPGAGYAAHPLITEDPGTQGAGHWQLEVNGEAARHSMDGGVSRHFMPATTLTYGAAERVDVLLTQAWLRDSTPQGALSGALDTAIDIKWRFYENGPFAVALKPGITLPTGRRADGYGAGRVGVGAALVAAYEREPFTFLVHGGIRDYRNVYNERRSLRHGSIAVVAKATDRLRLVLDTSRDTDPDPQSTLSLRQTVLGAIYSVTPDFDIDAGFRRGNDVILDRSVLLGIALRW